MFMKNFIKTSAVTLAASMYVTSASAGITKLVSFGDSLSDSGNVHAATGAYVAPYAGVNSNGPVWTQQLATALNVAPHTGSLTGGDGYAWGGARVTYGTGDGASVPSLQQQVDGYLASTGGVAEADIVKAAKLFAEGPTGTAGTGTGPSMSPYPSLMEHLVICLNVICGRWLRAGEVSESRSLLQPEPQNELRCLDHSIRYQELRVDSAA